MFKEHFSRISQLLRNFVFLGIPIFFFTFIVGCSNFTVTGKKIETTENSASYVSSEKEKGYFPMSVSGHTAPLCVSSEDFPGVIRIAKLFQSDIERVTNARPGFFIDKVPEEKEIIVIGTVGKSKIIDKLVKEEKLDVEEIEGNWESSLLRVVKKPFPGVERAFVIAGSDKRGTIYGMFDISRKIGVSPWYWWADVPVDKKENLYVSSEPYIRKEPAVKYRGIFINDEAPALSGWVYEKFGGFNHKFYEKVFELILRLSGNYLWPAMWGKTFFVEDTLNPELADEYGIVLGTSHHEPMMRANVEWNMFGSGPWNYAENDSALRAYWRKGIRRMNGRESIVTIGMRGQGDLPMGDSTNIALLEKIVKDQREIIEEVTGKPASATPQKWALYKEVQDYYNKGMRVPGDVTLLLCDDNWGNVRILPPPDAPPREGGYGMYYHFDFVGGPRSYKWLNTNQIPRIWEQMHLTYRHGVKRIWIVNVGDIKPMELPTDFFLDYAWNPEKWPAERLPDYTKLWAEEQFGEKHAQYIADILSKYTKYNSRRTPELLSPETYSLVNYREAERVVADYNKLAEVAERIYQELPSEYRDAYYQLVLFPVKACANLNEMYVTAGMNHLYAKQGRAATNELAEKVKELFEKDAELTEYYHTEVAAGKWNHMMSQTHIGYTYWQQPEQNKMPEVKKIKIPYTAEMGVAIEGSKSCWPKEDREAVLPGFDVYKQRKRYIEIFNRGDIPFDYRAEMKEPWLKVTPKQGQVKKEQRLWVNVDWKEVPTGDHRIPIVLTGSDGTEVTVYAIVEKPESPERDKINGFVESNGYVSIEAEHYTGEVSKPPIEWQLIPNLGRTASAMTPFPVTAQPQIPGKENSPRLEYQMHLFDSGKVKVKAYFSPVLNFYNTEGLKYGISFDDEEPKIVNIHKNDTVPDWEYPAVWNRMVGNNIRIMTSEHNLEKPGKHTLKFWMIDPGVVLQKLVVDMGGVKPSYLGPPESFYRIERRDK